MFDFLWRSERESNPHLSPLKSGECSLHCHYPAKIFRVATLSFRFVLQSKPAVTNLVKLEGALVSALPLGTIIL